MSELSRDALPGNHGFGVQGDTHIRIHSTNNPRSIGRYASHGCIRLDPNVANELFPALLHYLPHDPGQKNGRGIVHPLHENRAHHYRPAIMPSRRGIPFRIPPVILYANQPRGTLMTIVRAAVIQDSPVVFNLEATLAKVDVLVERAAGQGAQLVLVPEAFVSAYPNGLDFGARIGFRLPEGARGFSQIL